MIPEQWQHVRDLFEAALDREPTDIATWLTTQTSDTRVRAEVLSLLEHHSRAGSFMVEPVAERVPDLLAEEEPLTPGATVGPYTIIRELIDQSVRRGPPTRIAIKFGHTADGGLEVSVADDADPERRRRSFDAIEERVRQVHGEIEVVADEDHGTAVRVSLPPYTAQR